MAEQATADRRAPYVPWPTFEGLIEQLREHPLPTQIDRTILSNNGKRSGATVNYLAAASRFLGLTDEADAPTSLLRDLLAANAPNDQKAVLRRILEKGYGAIIALNSLENATPRQLDEALRTFGNDGSTHRKARKFFLDAAKAADVPLSPYIAARTRGVYAKRSGGAKAPRMTERRREPDLTPPPAPAVDLAKRDLETRVAMLEKVLNIIETKGNGSQIYLEAMLDVMREQLAGMAPAVTPD